MNLLNMLCHRKKATLDLVTGQIILPSERDDLSSLCAFLQVPLLRILKMAEERNQSDNSEIKHDAEILRRFLNISKYRELRDEHLEELLMHYFVYLSIGWAKSGEIARVFESLRVGKTAKQKAKELVRKPRRHSA